MPTPVRVGRPVARLASLAVPAFLLTTGCGGWTVVSKCTVRGSIQAADGLSGAPCGVRLTGEEPSEAVAVGKVPTTFEYIIPIAAPVFEQTRPLRSTVVVTCEGYEPQTSAAFQVEPGWRSCDPADVGVITVARQSDVR